jgi:predicted outer membrane protein
MGLAATLAALIFPIWSYADRSGAGADVLSAQTVATPYGPLSALDRDFVTKVRLAGLWELPAGEQAQRKGTTQAVRTAGRHLVQGHTLLDARVRDVAAKLGLSLPNQPNDQQKKWLAELNAARGQDFDRAFANILRLAHGRVFTVVAQVRATTQNSLVRGLADDANSTVLDHIKVLEATGYVDFGALAREMAASATPAPAVSSVPPAAGSVVPVTPSAQLPESAFPSASSASTAPSPAPSYPLPPPASSPPPSTGSP